MTCAARSAAQQGVHTARGTYWQAAAPAPLWHRPTGQDWDLLYLNAIFTTRGNPVSPHLIAIRGTPSAIGYIATPALAQRVLDNAQNPLYNAWVDIIFEVSVISGLWPRKPARQRTQQPTEIHLQLCFFC